MASFTQNIWNWPLWSQILLIATLGLVAHFWFGRLFTTVLRNTATSSSSARLWHLLRCFLWAAALSWLAVRFCIGTNPKGVPYEWGLYGRVLFVGLAVYLTNLFIRYFS